MKSSFSLIELILVVALISFVSSIFYFKPQDNKLNDAAQRLTLYLKQTRYQALIDNKEDINDSLWHRKRWTFKVFNCQSSVGGLYYIIYSDVNKKGHPSENESLVDPLSKKKIYSMNTCTYNDKRSKYTLLTKEYNIVDINISCNNTSSVGQLSFGNDGKVYTRLSVNDNESEEFELQNKCIIKLRDDKNREKKIEIMAKTGYARELN